jgi:hypothetical protein
MDPGLRRDDDLKVLDLNTVVPAQAGTHRRKPSESPHRFADDDSLPASG